ncbi:MAG: helix-turn-helix domain containing protein [Candidatus Aminicenantes bacterium]|nr:helix-turn-helix domain containing protein [Candidatus Aminicenantes bacterium]
MIARRAIIRAYEQTGNVSEVARMFRTTRKTVRKVLGRWKERGEKGLENLSRRPNRFPRKTSSAVEAMILAEREKTGYGRDRIARILREKGIEVKPSTVRYVLRRYGVSPKYKRSRYRRRCRFYDLESLYPLQHFQVDLKEVYDATTLSEETLRWAKRLNIPPYQWTAIDVKTRLRFLSYSYEKTFTNGLMFMLMIIYFLRSFGIEHKITLQTDNGEEFGGKSVPKLEYLNKKVFAPLKAELLHIPKGKKEYQAFVERSPQTDDNEFYIPQIERCRDLEEFYYRALRWQFVYNTKRHHSTLSMTPFRKLSMERKISNLVAIFPVVQLEKLTDLYPILFPLPGYYVSTNDPSLLDTRRFFP